MLGFDNEMGCHSTLNQLLISIKKGQDQGNQNERCNIRFLTRFWDLDQNE